MKQYSFVDPEETRDEMINVLSKGLKRALTEQEMKTVCWLSECEYQTRGIILDLFKELVERKEWLK